MFASWWQENVVAAGASVWSGLSEAVPPVAPERAPEDVGTPSSRRRGMSPPLSPPRSPRAVRRSARLSRTPSWKPVTLNATAPPLRGLLVSPLAEPDCDPEKHVNRCAVVYCPSEESTSEVAEADCASLASLLLPLRVALLRLEVPSDGASAASWRPRNISCALAFLRSPEGGSFETFALWGRCGGATAALRHAFEDPALAALICDSPCGDTWAVANLPTWLTSPFDGFKRFTEALPSTSCSGLSAAGADDAHQGESESMSLESVAAHTFVPALFIRDEAESWPSQTQALQRAYAGESQLVAVSTDAGHSTRPVQVMAKAVLRIVRGCRREDDNNPTMASALERLTSTAGGKPFKAQDALNAQTVTQGICHSSDDCTLLEDRIQRMWLSIAGTGAAEFTRIPLSAPESLGVSNGTNELPLLRIEASAVLPDDDSEVVVAWIIRQVDRPGEPVAYFARISLNSVSLSAVKSISENRRKMDVTILAFQHAQLVSGGVSNHIDIVVSAQGGVDLTVGRTHICRNAGLPRTIWDSSGGTKDTIDVEGLEVAVWGSLCPGGSRKPRLDFMCVAGRGGIERSMQNTSETPKGLLRRSQILAPVWFSSGGNMYSSESSVGSRSRFEKTSDILLTHNTLLSRHYGETLSLTLSESEDEDASKATVAVFMEDRAGSPVGADEVPPAFLLRGGSGDTWPSDRDPHVRSKQSRSRTWAAFGALA
eukprot:TRINITY_DN11435_c1_g2_i1.p1 TRINITY_DN11435_c1_g2~~TRINITY_DN11435_c1_g2_i1.p1  ORF type:complete len:783 (+),score=128.86 TRINITY_DN11435_c1_g2_i1:212-2350(+)